MKRILLLALAGLAAGCTTSEPVELTEDQQSRLAQALEGRTAGPAMSCVSHRLLRDNRSIGEGVILFNGAGDIVYVNRPPGGCPALDYGRTMITRTPSASLCSGDIVTVFDPVSRIEYGGCGLGEFVPNRRTERTGS